MDKKEIQKLPTIIDCIEYLSFKIVPDFHWEHIPPQISTLYGFSPEERFILKSRDDKLYLLPSGFRSFYFRGQNKYYPICRPSLFRTDDEKTLYIELLKRNEFMDLLPKHPIIAALDDEGIFIDKMAFAQHYCFWTPFLDLTCDIWAAAFFATTKYDSETDKYSPVDGSFEDGYGVFYVSKEKIQDHPKITPLGYNFFPRPHKQMAFTYTMQKSDDFNNDGLFEKYYFRHDGIASQRIFEMAFRQRKYWTNDILAAKANEIKRSKTISEKVFEDFINSEGISPGELTKLCESKGYTITKQPKVVFEKQYLEETKRDWDSKGGFMQIKKKILPFMMIKTEETNQTE